MTKFTSGSWNAEYVNDDYWEVYAIGNDWALASVHGTGFYDIDEANARLIAAAPEMYEALRRMAQFREDYSYAPDDWVLKQGKYEKELDSICDDIEKALALADGGSDE